MRRSVSTRTRRSTARTHRLRRTVTSVAILMLVASLPSRAQQPATAIADTVSESSAGARQWTGFRGSDGRNISEAAYLPLIWSDETIAWRSATPAFGQSTPVIWNDTIFTTSIEGDMKETLWVSALNLRDGTERWRRSFTASEQLAWSDYVSKAAPTPAVDGERFYAFFASGDLFALSHDGDVVWHRNLSADYGSVAGNHGVGNSVLLTNDAVVVLLTRKTYSYLLAVDRATGKTLWKADRPAGVAWSSPILAPEGREIVVNAAGRVERFDPATGDLLWSYEGLKGNHVPSATITADLVLVAGMAVEANMAIRRGRTGALADGDVAWAAGFGSNFGSPLAYGDCIYWVNIAGAARCVDPGTGAVRWTHRLPASIWATPLGHKDLVYFFTDTGSTQVLRASAESPEAVATNHLSVESPVTGVAVVDGAIIIRAGRDVIRVGRPEK